MRGKKVRLLNKGNSDYIVFDRTNLVKGTTKNGVDIPNGGVLLQNRVLAGYIQTGGSKKWRIIGCVDPNDKNIEYIQSYNQYGGGSSKNILHKKESSTTNKYNTNPKKVSLKSAVSLLRDYYREQFN